MHTIAVMKASLLLCCLALFGSTALAQLKRPRGVALSKAAFYQEGQDFTCLDGSQTIAFEKINDDYCDCDDGSDEPGTSACPSGSYHCTNAGYKPKYIPSSRVNDGICDCCDGTDEYDGRVKCANYCKELGKQMREELEKQRALLLEGYEIYKEYVQKGTEARQEKQNKLEELRTKRDELKAVKDDLEDKKKEVEAPEKEAKDKHRTEWEEKKAELKAETNKATAKEAFDDLDANQDQIVTVDEMQAHREFDIDNGGEVSPEEAREYLEDHPQVDFEVFYDKIWENIKEVYKKPGAETSEQNKIKKPKKKKRGLSALQSERLELLKEKRSANTFRSYKLDKEQPEEYQATHQRMLADAKEQETQRQKLKEIDEEMNFVTEDPMMALEPEADAATTTPHPTREQMAEQFEDPPEQYEDDEDEEEILEDDEEDLDEDEDDRKFPRGDLGDEYDNEYIPDYDSKYDPNLEEKLDAGEDFKIPEYDEETKKLIEAADQSRQAYDHADSEYREVDQELTETEKVLALDFGPNNEFYPLRGECYEYTDREYTYKLCPFEKTTQRNKHGGSETNLGHWGKFDGPENKKYSAMKYERGQNCYNGPDRSCYVKIECGLHNELRGSAEPNRCEYEYSFASPAACREPPPATFDPLHDEL